MAKAIDLGDYFRIPADTRDLNYGMFFTEGNSGITKVEEYTSHNTKQLNLMEMKKLLMKLDSIIEDMK
jgi:UDP-glucose 4-epimerase